MIGPIACLARSLDDGRSPIGRTGVELHVGKHFRNGVSPLSQAQEQRIRGLLWVAGVAHAMRGRYFA